MYYSESDIVYFEHVQKAARVNLHDMCSEVATRRLNPWSAPEAEPSIQLCSEHNSFFSS